MRLEITRRADLATRALIELSSTQHRLKSTELADHLDTSAGFLAQAMTPLVNRGWVRSDPGPTGGYTAIVEPGRVSVLEVIEAVEGPTETKKCVLEDRACSAGGNCALHVPWSKARSQFLAELSATSLSDLEGR